MTEKVEKADTNGTDKGWSGKIKNVCVGLGAMSGLLLGLFANFKGEPVAEKTWATLRDQVNKQTVLINRLHARTVFLQAHEEGRTAASLQLQIEDLKRQVAEAKRPAPACAQGFSSSTTGACVPTPRAPALKKAQLEVERDKALVELEAERKRALELEQKKLELARKLTSIKAKGGGGGDLLPALPKKLEDAK